MGFVIPSIREVLSMYTIFLCVYLAIGALLFFLIYKIFRHFQPSKSAPFIFNSVFLFTLLPTLIVLLVSAFQIGLIKSVSLFPVCIGLNIVPSILLLGMVYTTEWFYRKKKSKGILAGTLFALFFLSIAGITKYIAYQEHEKYLQNFPEEEREYFREHRYSDIAPTRSRQ